MIFDQKRAREEFQHMWNGWLPLAGNAVAYYFSRQEYYGFDQSLVDDFRSILVHRIITDPDIYEIYPPEHYFEDREITLAEAQDKAKAARVSKLAQEGNEVLSNIRAMAASYEEITIDTGPRRGSKSSENKALMIPDDDKPKFQAAMEELRDICYQASVVLHEKDNTSFFQPWQPSPEVKAKVKDILEKSLPPKGATPLGNNIKKPPVVDPQ